MRFVKKLGFTLVELSIVLVIIGLLIGGILAAKSMISAAKINGVVRDLGQYHIALTNYKTRYKKLPGDGTVISSFGNNNGGLDSPDEMGNFWSDLSLGVGLKNKQKTNYQVFNDSSPITELDAPRFNIDQYSTAVDSAALIPSVDNNANTDNISKNYFFYFDKSVNHTFGTVIATASQDYDPLKRIDAQAIDSKMDDGRGDTGMVQAPMEVDGYGEFAMHMDENGNRVTCLSSQDDGGAGFYTYYTTSGNFVDSNDYICSLRIQFGAINGDKE